VIKEVIHNGLCPYCDESFVPVAGAVRLACRFLERTGLKHICWNLIAYRRKTFAGPITEEELIVLGLGRP